jgi:hypothetical protein
MEDKVDSQEHLRRQRAAGEFTRLAKEAGRQASSLELKKQDIVEAAKRTRDALHRERYGAASAAVEPEVEPRTRRSQHC